VTTTKIKRDHRPLGRDGASTQGGLTPRRLAAKPHHWLGSLGRLAFGMLICRLPQSFACQRSLVEVRPAIPVCILAGSVGVCVRAGLCGASDPWHSSAAIQILRGLMVVQTSLVPSRKYALRTVRFPVNNPAISKLTHLPRPDVGAPLATRLACEPRFQIG
jgi:hypothetical protein